LISNPFVTRIFRKYYVKLKNKKFLVIFGPTGVGKTDIAITLAEQIPAEIINMDMGQCYAPLSIGTAKPDWQSQKIPHHLFDSINEPKNFTVTQYRKLCLDAMNAIWDRGNLPILVGGSAFYLQSLFFPPLTQPFGQAITMVAMPDEANSWDSLNEIDPKRASMIHPNDSYRINRALSIWHTLGKKPSDYIPLFNPPSSYTVLCLGRERKELYERIDSRVYAMIRDGWLEETKSLQKTPWEVFVRSKKIIGYDDIFAYLEGDRSPENLKKMIHAIQQKTRNYAKRQMTFWRKLEIDLTNAIQAHQAQDALEGEIGVVNLTLLDVDLYISQLLKKVNTWFA